MPYTFVHPEDLPQAEDRLRHLREETADIEMQLGNDEPHDPSGQPLTGEAYFHWRKQAKVALRLHQAEANFVKEWIRRRRDQNEEVWKVRYASAPNSCEVLIRGLLGVIGAVVAEHRFYLTEPERGLLGAARGYVGDRMYPTFSATGTAGVEQAYVQ
jgi:hypothetical protein